MTTCPTQYTLQSHLDGELSTSEAQRTARHLESCPACRRAAASMQAVQSVLSVIPAVHPPEGLLKQVQAAVATHGVGVPCDQARQMVVMALDRELDAEQLSQLQVHLAQCEDCRFHARSMGMVTGILQEVPPVEPPAGLRGRIEAAVERAAGSGTLTVRRLLTHDLRRRMAAAAGLAAAAAIMLAVVFRFAGLPPTSDRLHFSKPEITTEPPTAAPDALVEAPVIGPDSAAGPEAAAPDAPLEAAAPIAASAADTPRPGPTARRGQTAVASRSAARSRVAAVTPSPPEVTVPAHPRPTTTPQPAPRPPVTDRDMTVGVGPLISARPVSIARRSEVPVPSGAAVTTPRSAATPTMLSTPIQATVVPDPKTPSAPVFGGATLAKASPSTPPSLRTDHTVTQEARPTRLASASTDWLPAPEPSRSVYSSLAPSPTRLATASERISRELGDLKHGSTPPAIVVIK